MQESNCVWCGAQSEDQEHLCHECDALFEADRGLPLNKHEDWLPLVAPSSVAG